MNANELADKLQELDSKLHLIELFKSANMLRQQQAEIEALKKFIAESNALDKKLHESIQKANQVWDKATESILRQAKKK